VHAEVGGKSRYAEKMLNLIESAGDRVIFQPENLKDRDQTFERVLALYPDMRVEMDEAGNISLMAPGSLESSSGSSEVFVQLGSWAKRDGTGKAFDSSATYNLPTGAKMSPDASWVPKSVLANFAKKALKTVTGVVIAPAFVVEVRSPSDRLKAQERKCERWIKAGVAEVWLVDPIQQKVHVFLPGRKAEVLVNPKQVKSAVLDGFVLKCGPVWED
jgi:Uma2 family endonuclease